MLPIALRELLQQPLREPGLPAQEEQLVTRNGDTTESRSYGVETKRRSRNKNILTNIFLVHLTYSLACVPLYLSIFPSLALTIRDLSGEVGSIFEEIFVRLPLEHLIYCKLREM